MGERHQAGEVAPGAHGAPLWAPQLIDRRLRL